MLEMGRLNGSANELGVEFYAPCCIWSLDAKLWQAISLFVVSKVKSMKWFTLCTIPAYFMH